MSLHPSFKIGPESAAVITGSFLSGAMMNIFMLTIPVLNDTTTLPSQLVSQWARIYHYGHHSGPVMCITTAALYTYGVYGKHAAGDPWRIFAASAVTTLSMIPFTWIFMLATNDALFRAQTQNKDGQSPSLVEVQRLVNTWSWLNAVRSLFPLTGAILGLLGTLKVLVF